MQFATPQSAAIAVLLLAVAFIAILLSAVTERRSPKLATVAHWFAFACIIGALATFIFSVNL